MKLDMIGRIYSVEALEADGAVWTVGNFAACSVEEAIKKAKDWFKTESPGRTIGDVRLIADQVIQ